MVDRGILEKRLRALENLEGKLRSFASVPESEFLREDPIHDLAARYLHLAVECIIDIGNHILSARSVDAPGTYREVFSLLAREGVINEDLARRLTGWAGFRNVLVHLYLDIDHSISWRVIQHELGDLEEFRGAVAPLLSE